MQIVIAAHGRKQMIFIQADVCLNMFGIMLKQHRFYSQDQCPEKMQTLRTDPFNGKIQIQN